jgi:hypothetical protein
MRNQIKLILLFCVLLFFTSSAWIFGEEISKVISKKALWQGKKEVKITHLFTIGSEDFENKENYFLANIIDLKCDRHGNLYVLDFKNKRLNKYSSKGIFLKYFPLKKGRGPGEYGTPYHVMIDEEEKIYIVENQLKRITILDQQGIVKKVIKIIEPCGFADILLGIDGSIYLTKSRCLGKRIFNYDIKGKLINNFCEIHNKELLENYLVKTGSWERLTSDKKGNLYYSEIYPYGIKKFSAKGELLKCFSRALEFKPPREISRHGYKMMVAASSSALIIVLPDGKILNISRHIKEGEGKTKFNYWIDIFSDEGKWLISFSGAKFKTQFIRNLDVDPWGHLYLDYYSPYPHIKKFKIEFLDIN